MPAQTVQEISGRKAGAVRVRNLRLQRHFHVIHDEDHPLSASGRAFLEFLERTCPAAPRPARHRQAARRALD
jgi:hypothetical protein